MELFVTWNPPSYGNCVGIQYRLSWIVDDGDPTELNPIAENQYVIPIDIGLTECPLITVMIASLNGAFVGDTSQEIHQFGKYFSVVYIVTPVI